MFYNFLPVARCLDSKLQFKPINGIFVVVISAIILIMLVICMRRPLTPINISFFVRSKSDLVFVSEMQEDSKHLTFCILKYMSLKYDCASLFLRQEIFLESLFMHSFHMYMSTKMFKEV